MSVLEKIAYYQNRRDEVPNQELARELVETRNVEGIQEMADNLWHKNKSVRSDCLKVLYEIGYLEPELIADYVGEFLKLLVDKQNRMVWGAMIGLATITALRPTEIWENLDSVLEAMEKGTLITMVWGIKTLSNLAAVESVYNERIFPLLLGHLRICIPRDFANFAESIEVAVNDQNRDDFLAVLDERKPELKPSQLARLRKVTRRIAG